MKREPPSEEELTMEIKSAISDVINRSDKRVLAFSKQLGEAVKKNGKFMAGLKKAEKAGYDVFWGAQIKMEFVPAVKLEPSPKTPPWSKRNVRPFKIKLNEYDRKFLEGVKVTFLKDEK